MALEMSGCPVGTCPKGKANGSGERNEHCDRQGARRRLSDRESFSPLIYERGGERMSDYEMIMVFLTVLSLVVILITKDQK